MKTKYFLLTFLSIFSTIIFVNCSRKIEFGDKGPEQVLENFTVFETDCGKKIWDLTAAEAQISEKTKIILLNDFKVKFYNNDKLSSVLKSSKGKIDSQNNNFFTEDKTTVTTSDGEILYCDNLKYISKDKKIFTDSNVKIVRKDYIITGTGLEATPDLSVVIIKQNKTVLKR